MVSVEMVHGIYAKLENRPGTLERATRAITDKRVNVDGISLETFGNQGFLRVLSQRPKEVLDALRASGIEAYDSELVLASLPNKPGELHRATQEIASAQLNVEGVVCTADGRVAFRTSDNERAAQILRKL
jgi:hypothetical protein